IVYASTDGGATWPAMPAQPSYSNAYCPGGMGLGQSNGNILTADEGGQGARLWNGSTWSRNLGTAANATCGFNSQRGDWWICEGENDPRKWDGGTAWNLVKPWPGHTSRAWAFVAVGSDWYIAGNEYQNGSGPIVFKTADKGATFTHFETG